MISPRKNTNLGHSPALVRFAEGLLPLKVRSAADVFGFQGASCTECGFGASVGVVYTVPDRYSFPVEKQHLLTFGDERKGFRFGLCPTCVRKFDVRSGPMTAGLLVLIVDALEASSTHMSRCRDPYEHPQAMYDFLQHTKLPSGSVFDTCVAAHSRGEDWVPPLRNFIYTLVGVREQHLSEEASSSLATKDVLSGLWYLATVLWFNWFFSGQPIYEVSPQLETIFLSHQSRDPLALPPLAQDGMLVVLPEKEFLDFRFAYVGRCGHEDWSLQKAAVALFKHDIWNVTPFESPGMVLWNTDQELGKPTDPESASILVTPNLKAVFPKTSLMRRFSTDVVRYVRNALMYATSNNADITVRVCVELGRVEHQTKKLRKRVKKRKKPRDVKKLEELEEKARTIIVRRKIVLGENVEVPEESVDDEETKLKRKPHSVSGHYHPYWVIWDKVPVMPNGGRAWEGEKLSKIGTPLFLVHMWIKPYWTGVKKKPKQTTYKLR